ncbi:MAG TPA: RNA-binding S4 domain-containing protein [Baekduia sp.]|nr:RNA-binding S4 domain-containing protein [Baekduia sp.]
MDASEPVRLDIWLWAARFAKTRALAAELVKGGRVELNGQATKPAKEVKPGDRLDLTLGRTRMQVDVRTTARRRGPAKEAALLYAETPESREAREREAEQRRLAGPVQLLPGGRPTKRDRRRYERGR